MCDVDELRRHGYKGFQLDSYDDAYAAALLLVTQWYLEGYSGLDTAEAPNGFNYNYKQYFPVGTYFSYAAGLDVLTSALMIDMGYDSLQLVVEPQNALGSLRPAYFFETFSQIPPQNDTTSASIYKPGSSNMCANMFLVNPLDDWDNYVKYGYVRGDRARSVKPFSTAEMRLSAYAPSFMPDNEERLATQTQ